MPVRHSARGRLSGSETAFRFAIIAELAIKRRLSGFLGGPLGGMEPIRAFDKFAVLANDPIKRPGALFTGKDRQGVRVRAVVITHAGLIA